MLQYFIAQIPGQHSLDKHMEQKQNHKCLIAQAISGTHIGHNTQYIFELGSFILDLYIDVVPLAFTPSPI